MSKKYTHVVFIGRFSPCHIGHIDVIRSALEVANFVIIMIGSARSPRTIKNPWTYDERVNMIKEALRGSVVDESRVRFAPLRDQKYNDQKWATSVQELVDAQIQRDCCDYPNIGIIGHSKDSSSYYLKLFPQWDMIEHDMNEIVHATDIRSLLFEGKNILYLHGLLSDRVYEYIQTFRKTPEFELLVKEYKFIQRYKKAWEAAPYEPFFVTVDACVIQSGHILLVQRKSAPGQGLWALCGGFVNQDERLEDAMIRELREETGIKVPGPVLRGNIKARKVYDSPFRSERGRTITHAYLIELPPGPLPHVKGGDDAAKAIWLPFNDIREEEMFEDHNAIIEDLTGKL